MYRNYWQEEIRIRKAVSLLATLLNDEFKGDIPDPKKWLSLIEDLIDLLYAGDIIILDGIIRYEIVCDIDENGLIEQLSLIEKY